MSDNNLENVQVTQNEAQHRFEIALPDEQFAYLDYTLAGNNIIYTHTEVPVAYEGRGLAGKLAYFAMEYAKANDLKVQALCPFVTLYVRKHTEYQSITWGY